MSTRTRCCSHFSRVGSLHCQWHRSLAELAFTQMSSSKCWSYPIYPQSKARLQRFSQKYLTPPPSLFMLRQTSPTPAHSLLLLVLLLLLLGMTWCCCWYEEQCTESVQTNTLGMWCARKWLLVSLTITGHTCLWWRHTVPCLLQSARCRYKIVPTRQF